MCPTVKPYIGCGFCHETPPAAADCACNLFLPYPACGKCYATAAAAAGCDGSVVPPTPTSAPATIAPPTNAPPTRAPATDAPVQCPDGFPYYGCLHCWKSPPTSTDCATCPGSVPYIGCGFCYDNPTAALDCQCGFLGPPIPACGKCVSSEEEAVECEGSIVVPPPTPAPLTFAPMICPAPYIYQCGYCWDSKDMADYLCDFYCAADKPFAKCNDCHATQQQADECKCPGTQIKACDGCFNSAGSAAECSAPFLPTVDGTAAPPGTTPSPPVPETHTPGFCFFPAVEGCGQCWKTAAAAANCAAVVCAPGETLGCSRCFTTGFDAFMCTCPPVAEFKACSQCWSTQADADSCEGPL
ncbi:hypothetical protein DIPPA_13905 [Diplonema papillatum]|nr:hypothetical protein DIPPA_13905 [Diplonema papillatum]